MAFENVQPFIDVAKMVDPFGSINAGQQAAFTQQQQQAEVQQQALSQAQAQQQGIDVQAAIANPTPAAFAALQAKYPQQQAAYKAALDTYDKEATKQDLTSLGSVYAALSNEHPDQALALLKQRAAADTAAGKPVHGDVQGMIDAIESGDPDQAKGIAAYHITSMTSPEKLADLVSGGDDANKGVVIGSDSSLVDPRTGKVMYSGSGKTEYKTIKNADGSESIVRVGPEGKPTPGIGSGGWANFYGQFLAPTEGGYAARDGKSGAPVNYGVNQAANPDVDVKNLTPTAAAKLLHDRYWVPSGADNISDPALQAVVADTAVNMGVGVAKTMLAASGGDVQKYLAMRQQRYNKIGGPDLPQWTARNAKLAAFIGGTGQATQGGGAQVVYNGSQTAGGDADPASSLTGDEYLKTLPSTVASQVKALSEGRLDMPSSFALSKPYWQNLLQKTAQYDPSFDQTNAKTRVGTRKDFTSGKAAATITSFNTALGHLDTLISSADALNNGSYPFVNGVSNTFGNAVGKPQVKNFNAAKIALTGELAKAFTGGVGTQGEIENLAAQLDANGSPDQLHGVIGQFANLLRSKIGALGEQYQAGMGRSSDKINLLDNHAKATLAKLGIGQEGAPAATAPAARSAAPIVAATTRAQVAALPVGTQFKWTDGTVHVRR